jgi:hypothetical protein
MNEAEWWIDAGPTNPYDVFADFFKNYLVVGYSN